MIRHKTVSEEIEARLEDLEEFAKGTSIEQKVKDWLFWFKMDIVPLVKYGHEVIEKMDKIDELKSKIASLEDEIMMLEDERDDLFEEINRLQSEIEDLQDEKEGLSK